MNKREIQNSKLYEGTRTKFGGVGRSI